MGSKKTNGETRGDVHVSINLFWSRRSSSWGLIEIRVFVPHSLVSCSLVAEYNAGFVSKYGLFFSAMGPDIQTFCSNGSKRM